MYCGEAGRTTLAEVGANKYEATVAADGTLLKKKMDQDKEDDDDDDKEHKHD